MSGGTKCGPNGLAGGGDLAGRAVRPRGLSIGAVAITPTVAAGQRNAAAIAAGGFVIDRSAKTVEWRPDKGGSRHRPRTFNLPGGSSPALTKVVRALYTANEGDMLGAMKPLELARLWLIDDSGHVAARSRGLYQNEFVQTWPSDALRGLEDFGIEVATESYDSPRATRDAYPGAFPLWWLATQRTLGLLAIALVIVVIAIIALVVVL